MSLDGYGYEFCLQVDVIGWKGSVPRKPWVLGWEWLRLILEGALLRSLGDNSWMALLDIHGTCGEMELAACESKPKGQGESTLWLSSYIPKEISLQMLLWRTKALKLAYTRDGIKSNWPNHLIKVIAMLLNSANIKERRNCVLSHLRYPAYRVNHESDFGGYK